MKYLGCGKILRLIGFRFGGETKVFGSLLCCCRKFQQGSYLVLLWFFLLLSLFLSVLWVVPMCVVLWKSVVEVVIDFEVGRTIIWIVVEIGKCAYIGEGEAKFFVSFVRLDSF